MTPARHLSAAEVAAHLDGTLSPEDRAAADFHLSGCAECRAEVVACARLLPPAPMFHRSTVRWTAAAMAAGLVLFVVLRPARREPAVVGELERRVGENASAIGTVSPAQDATVAVTELRFTWHAQESATTYRVIVMDTTGARVWSHDLTDTTVTLPDSVHLRVGGRYYWQVDAARADGTALQSAQTVFRVMAR